MKFHFQWELYGTTSIEASSLKEAREIFDKISIDNHLKEEIQGHYLSSILEEDPDTGACDEVA